MIRLSLASNRRIQTANYSIFNNGILHPDRIMKVHDLVYVVQGEWEIIENGAAYLLKPGDVIFLFCGRRHYGKIPCSPGTKTRYIHFYPESGDAFFNGTAGEPLKNASLNLATKVSCASDEKIRRLFDEVIHSYWSSIRLNQMMAGIKLAELLVCLAKKNSPGMERGTDAVDFIINTIEREPGRTFSIDDLTDKAMISRRNLTSRFKEKTGVSIKQFQLNLKIQMAAAVLMDSPFTSIKEVAAQFNFYDEFHFSKLFKQKTGKYPSEYRKGTRK